MERTQGQHPNVTLCLSPGTARGQGLTELSCEERCV